MLIDVLGPPEFEQWDNCAMSHIQDMIDKSSVRRAFYFDRLGAAEVARYELKAEDITETGSAFYYHEEVMPILPDTVKDNFVTIPSKEVALVGKDAKGYLEPDTKTIQGIADHFIRALGNDGN